MIKIKIFTESSGFIDAEIDEKMNPKTAKHIIDTLPIEAIVNTWGDEIYFDIPVRIDEENPQEDVELGSLAYWPPGTSFCIFFGLTPMSKGDLPTAASPVNVFGKITGNMELFRNVNSGEKITVELAE